MIRFLFKVSLFGFLALLVLPSLAPPDDETSLAEQSEDSHVEMGQAAARMAGGIAAELGDLCLRQPAICESGIALAIATVERAQLGWEIASDMFAPTPAEPTDPIETGGI